jgi:choline kinase
MTAVAEPLEAIILAAGTGSRLGVHTARRPKALVEIGGTSILERQLAALGAVPAIASATVVVGYRAEQIVSKLEQLDQALTTRTIYNPHYADSGALNSLSLALRRRPPAFVVLNGDTLFGVDSLRALVAVEDDLALLYTGRREFGPDAVKVVASRRAALAVGKHVPESLANGESAGIFRCVGAGAGTAVATAERMLRDPAALQSNWHALVQQLVEDGLRVALQECEEASWYEVDDAHDLAEAGNGWKPRAPHAGVRGKHGEGAAPRRPRVDRLGAR